MHIFLELSIVVLLTTIIAGVIRFFKQPLVVGYIFAGILLGPYALNLLQSTEYVELFSKIGISILLFIVGLSLNPETIKETGKISVITGLGQVVFTSVIGFGILYLLGFSVTAAVYSAIALTFSSTIIVLKLLTDRGDTNKLYGKIAIGLLLVQDVVATLILLVVSVIGGGLASGAGIGITLGMLLLKGTVIISILYLISKYVLPKLSTYIATSPELLLLFSISWGLGMASLFYYIGFSIEIGALVAGVTLSVSSYAYEIGSRMRPLRDFFIVLFFVLLGSEMVLSDIGTMIVPAILLSLFVLIGNPLIVFVLMNMMGYKNKTGFMAGLTVAQVSEFSLILMALAFSIGHIDQQTVSFVTLVAIITIVGSTYLFNYSDKLFALSKGMLQALQIRKKLKKEPKPHLDGPEMIIFGYDRVGFDFARVAQSLGFRYVVVDFNPDSIRKMQDAQIPFRFGDAEDVEFLQEIGIAEAKIIVSTIPEFKTNKMLVSYYRRSNTEGIAMVISHDIKQARELYLEGASYVVMPHYLGAHHASSMLAEFGLDISLFEKERNRHLVHLAHREQILK